MKLEEAIALVSKRAEDKRRAVEGDTFCRYRMGEDTPTPGLACFLGAAIPDEMYEPKMEGYGAIRIFNDYPELDYYLTLDELGRQNSLRFWCDVQGVHDNRVLGGPDTWEMRLASLFTKYRNIAEALKGEHNET